VEPSQIEFEWLMNLWFGSMEVGMIPRNIDDMVMNDKFSKLGVVALQRLL